MRKFGTVSLWIAASFVAFCFLRISGMIFARITPWLIHNSPVWSWQWIELFDRLLIYPLGLSAIVIAVTLGQRWNRYYEKRYDSLVSHLKSNLPSSFR